MNLYKHIINIILRLRLRWWCKVFYRGSSTNGQPNTTFNAIECYWNALKKSLFHRKRSPGKK